MQLKNALLLTAALGVGLIGLGYTVSPSFMLGNYGVTIENVSGLNLVRSGYGGMFLGFATLFALGALRHKFTHAALVALFAFMAGFAVGRTVSIVVDGVPHPILLGILGIEIGYTLGAVYFLFAKPTGDTKPSLVGNA